MLDTKQQSVACYCRALHHEVCSQHLVHFDMACSQDQMKAQPATNTETKAGKETEMTAKTLVSGATAHQII